jgi:hypothetical protein
LTVIPVAPVLRGPEAYRGDRERGLLINMALVTILLAVTLFVLGFGFDLLRS